MRTLFICFLLMTLSACSPRGIRCDGSLRPINPPAAAGHKP